MYNQNNPGPYGHGPYNQGPYGGGSQYQQQRHFNSPYHFQGVSPYGVVSNVQSSSLISKVMGLLAVAFIIATIGGFVGFNVISGSWLLYFVTAIAGLVVLFILQAMINQPGINLFLLYLFAFLEGMSLGPLLGAYLGSGMGYLVMEAFLITAVASITLGLYAWVAKADFSKLGQILFAGLIILIVAMLINIFFQSTIINLIICIAGIAIFSGFMLYDVQKAKYMADTMPNAIGLTVSLFLNIINLFLFILRLLSILQGGNND